MCLFPLYRTTISPPSPEHTPLPVPAQRSLLLELLEGLLFVVHHDCSLLLLLLLLRRLG